jgi:hypothetical protein
MAGFPSTIRFPRFVIAAKAGIQAFFDVNLGINLDTCFRGYDEIRPPLSSSALREFSKEDTRLM